MSKNKEKNEKEFESSGANIASFIIRLIVCLATLGIGLFLSINTFKLITEPFAYKKVAEENKIEEHVKEILNKEESLIFWNDDITENEINEMIDEVGPKRVNDYIVIELIILEICYIIVFFELCCILNFLSKKNLLNPFTDDSISQVKKILKLELALIIIGAVAYIGEDILFTFWGATTLKTSETLTSLFGDLFLMLLFTVLYYILKVGQNKIAEKN